MSETLLAPTTSGYLGEADVAQPQTPALELFGILDDLTVTTGDVEGEPTMGYCSYPFCVTTSPSCNCSSCGSCVS
jgi:hypothetical protein